MKNKESGAAFEVFRVPNCPQTSKMEGLLWALSCSLPKETSSPSQQEVVLGTRSFAAQQINPTLAPYFTGQEFQNVENGKSIDLEALGVGTRS